MKKLTLLLLLGLVVGAWMLFKQTQEKDLLTRLREEAVESNGKEPEKLELSDAEWKKKLTSEEYLVLRQHGTERAFSGKYNEFKGHGIFNCVACDLPLFNSDDKFDSGTGWPSFTKPIDPKAVGYTEDTSLLATRVEVHCNRCNGHLGHVFEDGPKPTGLRYCMNSVCFKFQEGT